MDLLVSSPAGTGKRGRQQERREIAAFCSQSQINCRSGMVALATCLTKRGRALTNNHVLMVRGTLTLRSGQDTPHTLCW